MVAREAFGELGRDPLLFAVSGPCPPLRRRGRRGPRRLPRRCPRSRGCSGTPRIRCRARSPSGPIRGPASAAGSCCRPRGRSRPFRSRCRAISRPRRRRRRRRSLRFGSWPESYADAEKIGTRSRKCIVTAASWPSGGAPTRSSSQSRCTSMRWRDALQRRLDLLAIGPCPRRSATPRACRRSGSTSAAEAQSTWPAPAWVSQSWSPVRSA